VWHGNHATVGNPRQTRLFTTALEVYARAGLFVGPRKFDAAVSVARPTVHHLNECSLDLITTTLLSYSTIKKPEETSEF
jgi:hypothetical protein